MGTITTPLMTIDKVEEKLKKYLLKNTDVKDRLLLNGTFDPWNLKLSDSSITKYTLLTDDRGEAFYQQAVSYMKVNSPALAIEAFSDLFRDAEKVSAGEKNYEDMKQSSEDELARLKEQAAQQENKEDSGSSTTDNSAENSIEQNSSLPEEREDVPENPLKVIAAIRKSGLTGLVTNGKKLSEKKISGKSLPSKSNLKKGNMKIERKFEGVGDDFLFREYLLKHFSDYSQKKTEGDLLYETEYLIAGKMSDRQNIDSVIKKLLLFREVSNYTFCLGSKEHSAQAGALAAALSGMQ